MEENIPVLAKNIQETGQEYDFHIRGYSVVDFFLNGGFLPGHESTRKLE